MRCMREREREKNREGICMSINSCECWLSAETIHVSEGCSSSFG